jgi:peptide/nickel transport system permease protein
MAEVFKKLSSLFTFSTSTVGLVIVLFWCGSGLISLVWTPFNPNTSLFDTATDLPRQNAPPNSHNWLGTDHLGRDILSRLMHGTQVVLLKTRLPQGLPLVGGWSLPLGVALWGVLGSLSLGAFLGLNAGYRGGWWDSGLMLVLDALIAFPQIILYLVLIAGLGRGDLIVILAITVTGAPGVARLTRSLTLEIKTHDYIAAAQTRGENSWYIMFVEILPNAFGPLLVDALLRVGYAIFAIATLGFLGIGLPPPDPDWGSMVADARQYIFINQWAVICPAIAIASLVIGLNLFADRFTDEA